MLSEMNGSSAGLPTLPLSADGVAEIQPRQHGLGSGRVMRARGAPRTTISRVTLNAHSNEGSVL